MHANQNHLKLLIDHGDLMERGDAELIANRLPNYAEIWSRFIGNDGYCQKMPLVGASDVQQSQQRELGELVYTGLESALCINRLRKKYSGGYAFQKPLTEDVYLDVINDHFVAYSHVGRIRDVLNKAASTVKPVLYDEDKNTMKAWGNKFEGLYDERCVVVHCRKVPWSFIEDSEHIEFLFPKLADTDNGQTVKWSGKEPWENASPKSMDAFGMILEDLTETVLKNFNISLGIILGFAKECFGDLRVVFPDHSSRAAFANIPGTRSDYVASPNNATAASGVVSFPSGRC